MQRPLAPGHPQAEVAIDGRTVEVDEALAPLIESLWRHGIATVYSCQEEDPPPGGWRDESADPRFQIVLPDVEELRSLIEMLASNHELFSSAHRLNDAPRWEYGLSVQPDGARLDTWPDPAVRLQVAVYIPLRQLDPLLAALNAHDLSG